MYPRASSADQERAANRDERVASGGSQPVLPSQFEVRGSGKATEIWLPLRLCGDSEVAPVGHGP